MRTSFHHQPEAQHPKSSAIHKLPADYPICCSNSGQTRVRLECPLVPIAAIRSLNHHVGELKRRRFDLPRIVHRACIEGTGRKTFNFLFDLTNHVS